MTGQKISFNRLLSWWKVVIYLLTITVTILAIMDMRAFHVKSIKWTLIRMGIILAITLTAFVIYSIMNHKNKWITFVWLDRIPVIFRIILALGLDILPAYIFIYSDLADHFTGFFLRVALLSIVSLVCAILLFARDDKWKLPRSLLVCFTAATFIYTIAVYLSDVRTTPFSLSWSEGNRFYDYSLTFARNLYKYSGVLKVPYNSPGRYALWGSLFLIPGLPIWVHRLWNEVLWLSTPLILMIILAWKIKRPIFRWIVILWGTLFILQGPIYPHLIVPMIVLAIFIHSDKFWVKVIAGAVVSYYAGISRFTWAVLPGIWLVLYDLFNDYPKRSGNWVKRLSRPTILGLAGMIPGAMASWGLMFSPDQSFGTKQPLLAYRLLPNATFSEGILLGAVMISLPILSILIWLITSRRFSLTNLAQAALWISLFGLAAVGLVASIKIGGGGNLHNLDMYILTLVFVVTFAVGRIQKDIEIISPEIPQGIIIALICLFLVPAWFTFHTGSPLQYTRPDLIKRALTTIQKEVGNAKTGGEVLFIDQRQLLTFGYVKNVQLVPDYEKKYMMDQAMADNAAYFDKFYMDLRQHRFAMIIASIQKINFQQQNEGSSEENNAYVKWVTIPLLTYYEPVITGKKVDYQILVPRP